MDWISGKKTYLAAIAVGIVTALQAAGLLTDEQAQAAYGGLAAFGLYSLRQGVSKSGPAAAVLLALGLASAPAYAQEQPAPPTVGCHPNGCGLYALSIGWPRPTVGVNAVEFVRLDVQLDLDEVWARPAIRPLATACPVSYQACALAMSLRSSVLRTATSASIGAACAHS